MIIVWNNKFQVPEDKVKYDMLLDMWAEDTKNLSDDVFGSAFTLCRKKCDFVPSIAKFLEIAEEVMREIEDEKNNRPLTPEQIKKQCDDEIERVRRGELINKEAFRQKQIELGYDPDRQVPTQVGKEFLKRLHESIATGVRKEKSRHITDV